MEGWRASSGSVQSGAGGGQIVECGSVNKHSLFTVSSRVW